MIQRFYNNIEDIIFFLNQRKKDFDNYMERTKEIINKVMNEKENAIIELTKKYDYPDFSYDDLFVSEKEIEDAYNSVEKEFLKSIEVAFNNIYEFHLRQKEETWFYFKNNSMLGQIILPLERVGLYIPGGLAAYPSTILMNFIPAKIANVKEIIMCSPPSKSKQINKYVLATAKYCGIEKIFKIGGAQAITAMAYGINPIPKVDKIVGPGNIWVATAKKILYGEVDIDSIAGPSEILIITDGSINPKYIAADFLSQAEHDEKASCILITTDEKFTEEVEKNIDLMLKKFENPTAKKSISEFSAFIIVPSIEKAIDISNTIAPEHLEICCKDYFNVLKGIKNAGSIFLGEFSPEAIGDYVAGANHVLPTLSTARFSSPLGVYDFVKKLNVIEYSKQQFLIDAKYAINIAEKEGLLLHANSLKVRLENV